MNHRLSLLLESSTPDQAALLFEQALLEAETAASNTLAAQVATFLSEALPKATIEATAADEHTLRVNLTLGGIGVSGKVQLTATDGSFAFDGIRTDGRHLSLNGYGRTNTGKAVAIALAQVLHKELDVTEQSASADTPPLADIARQLQANMQRLGGLVRTRVTDKGEQPVIELFYEPSADHDVFLVVDIAIGYIPTGYIKPDEKPTPNPAHITARLHRDGKQTEQTVTLTLGTASKSASIALHVHAALRKLVSELTTPAQ